MPSGIYTRTEVHKKLIREAANRPDVLAHNREWHTGKKYSEETNKKKGLKGKDNPSFTGTDMEYYRNIALERDNYTCNNCKLREPEIMEVDHFFPQSRFPEVKFELENLVTMCPNCHKRKTVMERKRKIY